MAGPSAAPKLPNKKKDKTKKPLPATSQQLPIITSELITLEDGTQVPIKIPPHMGQEQARALVEFLRSNPVAAKAMYDQAQSILTNSPGLARQLINMPVGAGAAPPTEAAMAQYEVLKDDPEVQAVMADVQANGPSALEKYWDDKDLMSKISQKLRAANLGPAALPSTSGAEGKPGAPPLPPTTLHEAAKRGDAAAARRMIEEEGASVNGKNERDVTALGIAVGFNRVEVVQLLIEKGVDVMLRDGKGNTVLHYAAGYGRKEVAQLLLDAGAEPGAVNEDKQTPADVAQVNREMGMVEFMAKHVAAAGGPEAPSTPATGEAAPSPSDN